jgi:hypothetical protein
VKSHSTPQLFPFHQNRNSARSHDRLAAITKITILAQEPGGFDLQFLAIGDEPLANHLASAIIPDYHDTRPYDDIANRG